MEVTVLLVKGNGVGRRLTLGPNHKAELGAGDVDFPILGDGAVARRHARLESDAHGCILRDLDSDTGTFVNGQRVLTANLSHGDRIRIGNAELQVSVAGATAPTGAVAPDLRGQATGAPAPTRTKADGYRTETCRSGLIRHVGKPETIAGVDLVFRLGQALPALLLIPPPPAPEAPPPPPASPAGAAEPEPEESAPPPPTAGPGGTFLYDWFPAEISEVASPRLIEPAKAPYIAAALAGLWAGGQTTAFFTRKPVGEVLAHLRAMARPEPDSLLGIAMPKVLELLLAVQETDFGAKFMAPFEAVCLPCAQPPGHWQLFAKQPLDGVLASLGLFPAPPPPPPAAPAPPAA